jgi:integrase
MKGRSGGSIYERPGTALLWIKFYDAQGRPHRESTGTANLQEAKGRLAIRMGAIAKGEPIAINPTRVTVGELLDDLKNDYTTNGKVLGAIAPGLARLREAFGRWRAAELTTAALRAYIAQHQRSETHPEGLSNATLNRDLSALRRAYSLAAQGTPPKVIVKPFFPMLKEAPPRRGFFERDQFEAVRLHLPADLQPVATFEYLTGWRNESEVYRLTWEHVRFTEGVVRLNPGEAKNDEAREFPFTAELRALLLEQRERTEGLQRKLGRIIPWVFHRNGRPVKDMRRTWEAACTAAGLPGRYQHDFRRTAVRNLVRAGVPERVAMQLTGHKTRSVFERYNIVSEGDLRAAVAKLDQAAETSAGVGVRRVESHR